MSTLSFKHMNKIYENNVQAVFDFNLEIQDKEFIVFVGPSGCGKSTTLRMVAGLENITSGELYIDNVLVNNVEPKDRNIAMVFQNYALYPHMTVYGNMAFALRLRKVPCPVFNIVPEAEQIRAKNKELIREAKALRRLSKKKNEPKELVDEISKRYDEIIANEDAAKALEEDQRVYGIYEEKIASLNRQVKIANSEINKYSKARVVMVSKLEKASKTIEELENVKKGATEEAAAKIDSKLTKQVELKKQYEAIINEIDSTINSQEFILGETLKEIDYYSTNEVPLFKSRKLSSYEMDIEINKAAKILDLERYLLRKPSALSGGQRQRVALGRCIVRNPKVFLMDEPLSNLDAKLRVQTRSEIINIHKKVNATTIYVTHDQTEAMTMADRIVVMKDGYIQQIDTPEVIYRDPTNIFVAGFIGNPAMNFLDGVFDGKCICLTLKNNATTPLSIKLNAKQIKLLSEYKDKEIVVGVRPEKILLSDSENLDKNANKFDIVCNFRELLGYESVVYSTVCGQKLLVKVSSEQKIKAGDEIKVGFNNENIYLFDKETTQRIK